MSKSTSNKNKKIERPYPLVAASVSPYGSCLGGHAYDGEYGGISDKDLAKFFRKHIYILAEEKPDLLAIETIPNL